MKYAVVAALASLASSAALASDYTGFWKEVCTDAFGISIKATVLDTYSISFCGPGGCGPWKPDSRIEGDPEYRVVDSSTLEVHSGEKWRRLTKCTTETNPKLDYSTMLGQPRPANPEVTYKPYYEGIPDYEHMTVFRSDPGSTHSALRSALREASVSDKPCLRSTIKSDLAGSHELRTNICDAKAYKAIKALLASLAPSLDARRWTFRKVDLDGDGEPELMVEHVDLIGEAGAKDSYLSIWHLRYDGKVYRPTYAGPFLAGTIHALAQFGPPKGRQVLFVRHQSCTECHAWTYLTVVDLLQGSGTAFEFTYDEDHGEFRHTIEYALPGSGHSVDADVETRLLRAGTEGPHLMQHFRFDDGKNEWWVFRCMEFRCDYDLSDRLPAKYRQAWKEGKRL